MDDYHKADHVKLVDEMLQELDGEDFATRANALTGGCMRGEDALKLLKMVALAALHDPGKEVIVAGMGARVVGIKLRLFLQGDVATKNLPVEAVEKEAV